MKLLIILEKVRNKLIQYPYLALITVLISYLFILTLLSLISDLMYNLTPYNSYLILIFIIRMIVNAAYSLYIIPILLQLPNGKQNFSEYAVNLKINKTNIKFKPMFLGLAIGVVPFLTSILIYFSSGDFLEVNQFDLKILFGIPNMGNQGYFHFIYHIVPALWEEIIFRGIMLYLLLKTFSPHWAIIIDGVFFGLVHFEAIILIGYRQVIFNICFGISLAYLYFKTNNLIPCIIAHYIHNILQTLGLFSIYDLIYYLVYFPLFSLVSMFLSIIIISLSNRRTEQSKTTLV